MKHIVTVLLIGAAGLFYFAASATPNLDVAAFVAAGILFEGAQWWRARRRGARTTISS